MTKTKGWNFPCGQYFWMIFYRKCILINNIYIYTHQLLRKKNSQIVSSLNIGQDSHLLIEDVVGDVLVTTPCLNFHLQGKGPDERSEFRSVQHHLEHDLLSLGELQPVCCTLHPSHLWWTCDSVIFILIGVRG